ncbi:uncharacterized protein [Panulirus ornatus]|uniref:uncharacterized protein n=1 Tax=Panulirus ornatus TaxID=150431 RepID=UPI003A8506E3
MKGRLAAMFHYVAVALLLLASSALADRLHQTLSNFPSLSQDSTFLINRDLTRDAHLTPVSTHLTSSYDLSKTTLHKVTPTRVLDPSPSKDPWLTNFSPNHDLELDLAPSYELKSSSFTSLNHELNPLISQDKASTTDNIKQVISTQVLVPSKTDDLSHGLMSSSSSSSHNNIHSPILPFIPSPLDPFLFNTSEITLPNNKNALPSPHNTTHGITVSTESSSSNSNATITQEEFNSILTRFSLDALQATQIAERLGLAGTGAAELEQELTLGGDLQGPGGPNDRPQALPLGRIVRTTPRRREASILSQATRRLFLGDPSLCYTGTCEFFLMCWLGGGLIDGGCGGFLFACCTRPNQRGQRGPESFREDSAGIIPVDYGPIRNDEGCGLSASSRLTAQRRIVGGTEAGFGSFPWQAYIRIGSSRCGGSLINQYHVVTAGHCVARARPHQIRVTLGDYVLNSEREPLSPLIFGATDIKVHPNFRFTPQADRFDVAVITLDAPVRYQPHVQPICLPEKGTDWLGSYAWAAGWGALQSGSRLRPKTLQVVDVPILDSRLCEDWHREKGINVIIYDEMMCAGYNQGGKDSCQGDSGGPLMIQDGGRWYLAGIVSAGYSCAQGKQPGIYHKVSYTSDWISWAANT